MANIISDETIEYVGILAKLELNEEEKEQAKKDMGAMLDYIDKLNDGNLNYNSENSYLLEYENENNHLALSYNFPSNQLVEINLNDDNTRIIWTSSDESLMIASNYYEETNLLKFTITYDNGNKTLSVIKQIF